MAESQLPTADRQSAMADQRLLKKRLAGFGFAVQSMYMESNWAAEHLQVIRTLMERSALYRRALAPIMIFNGVVGLAAAGLGWGLGRLLCSCGQTQQ